MYQQQELFIGDEPFSALDPLMTSRLLETVFAQHNSVIMVMHDRELAMTVFDRVIALDKGRLVLDSKHQSINQQQITKLFQTSAVA
jgi:phosphonate transport system ATP-binding protein